MCGRQKLISVQKLRQTAIHLIFCSAVWYSLVQFGIALCCLVQFSTVWYSLVQFGTALCCLVQFDTV